MQKIQSKKKTDLKRTEDDRLGFWALLCKRAATVQRVYQYDGNLSFNNEFQRVLGEYDWVFRKYEVHNESARLAQEAIKLEDSIWSSDKNPNTKGLSEIIKVWEDAAGEAEELRNPYALLAIYWSLGNALYAPNSYKYRKALEVFEKALSLISSADLETQDEAGLLTTLGWVSYYAGDYSKAVGYFNDSGQKWNFVNKLAIKENGLAGAYRGLASTYQRLLQIPIAIEAFNKMIVFASELSKMGESKLQLIWGELRIGSFYKFIGDLSEADKHLTLADQLWLEYSHSRENDRGMNSIRTMILNNRADLLIRRGIEHNQAQNYLLESIKIGEVIPDKRSQAYSYWFLSLLHISSEEWDQAMGYLEKSIKLFHEMTIPRYEFTILLSKARVYCAFNAPLTAKWLINESIDDDHTEDRSLKVLIKLTRAYVCVKNKEYQQAIKLFDENIPLLSDLKYELAVAKLDFATVLLETGNRDQARQNLDQSRSLCEQFGYQALLRLVNNAYKNL